MKRRASGDADRRGSMRIEILETLLQGERPDAPSLGDKAVAAAIRMRMMRCPSSAWFALALALAGSAAGPQAAPPAPVLVELFTSEGCSSCPPADALLQKLVDSQPVAGVEIVALGQHVDYWDQLGWKDRFSSATFTRRQQQYSTAFNNESSYTPQMIVDGRAEFVGSQTAAAHKAIERAAAAPHAYVRIATELPAGNRLFVSVSVSELPRNPRDRADLVVAITEEGLRSNVRSGENHGRVLAHAAVVRAMKTIAEAIGAEPAGRAEMTLAPDWQRANLKVVAFVQERSSRHILGAASVSLQNARR